MLLFLISFKNLYLQCNMLVINDIYIYFLKYHLNFLNIM